MRAFSEIRTELGLKEYLPSPLGTLYFNPTFIRTLSAPGILVRHFDSKVAPALTQAYVSFMRALQDWVGERPELAYTIRIEQPIEVGSDFLTRPYHMYYTSTRTYVQSDDPPETPEELEEMRRDLRAAIAEDAANPRDALITRVLTRSLLEPTSKTYFEGPEFIVVEPEFTPEDIEQWARLEQMPVGTEKAKAEHARNTPSITMHHELLAHLSEKAKEGYSQQQKLLPARQFERMESLYKRDGVYQVARANRLFEKRWLSSDEFEARRIKLEPLYPRSWNIFASRHHDEFKARLAAFRGDRVADPLDCFRTHRTQMFLSDKDPFRVLVRWLGSQAAGMNEAIALLEATRRGVQSSPVLAADLTVVELHERGSDWVICDCDRDAIPLQKALGNTATIQARARVIAALEKATDAALASLSARLQHEPPADGLYWSPGRNTILVMDMQ